MSSDWQDGQIVLRLRVLEDSSYPDRLLLRPLGIAVTGVGVDIVVPGVGRTDLRDLEHQDLHVDFGEVVVAGPRAREILDDLAHSHPDIGTNYRPGAEGIVVMDAGPKMGDDLLAVFRDNTYVRANNVLADIRGLLDSDNRPMLSVALCEEHRVPQICPFQH